jgi:hypothetical protein
MASPDTWSEVGLVTISAQAGTDVAFQCLTETVDIDIGDKDFDVISTLCGARLVKFTPQDVTTITLEAYPVEAGTAGFTTATTGTGFFDLVSTVGTAQPLVYTVDKTRTKYRIAIMWTDATSVTAAGQVVAPANFALRVVAADGYFTSVKPSFTDGVLKFTVTYKVAPFDKSASANVKVESVGGASTATLTALASYTSTDKW